MKILDLDMDYFMEEIATGIAESREERLLEDEYGGCVWSEQRIRKFLEDNLGLSKERKIKGRIVTGHNEALFFWQELITEKRLETPFEVIHIDSHADLGLGYLSWTYILDYLLQYPVEERCKHTKYVDCFGKLNDVGIGDYLLYAIAFRWINKLTYCANPNGDKNDYVWETLKDFEEKLIWDTPVENVIQLVCNPDVDFPSYDAEQKEKQAYLKKAMKEPEVPLLIIPSIQDVKYDGDFDFVVLAQSPNYTPASADFIMDIVREYIVEI